MNIKTLRVRVKDNHAKDLSRQAVAVNTTWNYVNNLSSRSIKERGRFLSAHQMQEYTSGASKLLGLHSQTIQRVCAEYALRRDQYRKRQLSWRKSFGARRSLGWIPINTGAAKWKNGRVKFNGKHYKVWDSFDLSGYKFRSASFNEDARGRWYFNVVVTVQAQKSGSTATGLDLGCKDAVTTSSGDRLSGRWHRRMERDLRTAQRARKPHRVRSIHAKIRNCRKDDIHKFTSKLVAENALIVIGSVSSENFKKTRMSKSVYDAGWGMLKTMLKYKCDYAGVVFEEVNEAYTTQTCSCCGVISTNSPKGRAGLGIREWTCECGVTHDRDVNAARNILALGHERLAGGIPVVQGREGVNTTCDCGIMRETYSISEVHHGG